MQTSDRKEDYDQGYQSKIKKINSYEEPDEPTFKLKKSSSKIKMTLSKRGNFGKSLHLRKSKNRNAASKKNLFSKSLNLKNLNKSKLFQDILKAFF